MGCASSNSPIDGEYRLKDIVLTSTAVTKPANGHYQDHDSHLLIPHEAIRRDILRAEHSLKHMDVVKYPWHIVNFYRWISEYFFLAVHFHHDMEEKVLGPYYQKLGETHTDFGTTADHKGVLEHMDAIQATAKSLLDLVTAGNMNAGKAQEQQEVLRKQWLKFKDYFFLHLHEEEVFWPPVYNKHGTNHADKVVKLILASEMKLKGADQIAGQAMSGAVFDALGMFPPSKTKKYNYTPPANALVFAGPWCGQSFLEAFKKKVPFIARALVFPAFHKTYIVKWRALIESLCDTVQPTIP